MIYWFFALDFTLALAFTFALAFALALGSAARGINGLARSDDSMGVDEDLALNVPDTQPRTMLQ